MDGVAVGAVHGVGPVDLEQGPLGAVGIGEEDGVALGRPERPDHAAARTGQPSFRFGQIGHGPDRQQRAGRAVIGQQEQRSGPELDARDSAPKRWNRQRNRPPIVAV